MGLWGTLSSQALNRELLASPGFPHSLVGKESACNAGDLDLIPGLGRCPGEGKGYPLRYWPGE